MLSETKLRARIFNKVIFFGLILGILGVGWYFVNQQKVDYKKKLSESEYKIADFNARSAKLEQQYQQHRESYKIMQDLDLKNSKSPGTLIDEFKKELTKLRFRFKILKMDMQISTPTELQGNYKKKNAVVLQSEVELKVSAMTDEHIYMFVEKLQTKLPGYISMHQLNVRRSSQKVDSDLLAKIKEGEAPKGLVDAEIKFSWYNLKVK